MQDRIIIATMKRPALVLATGLYYFCSWCCCWCLLVVVLVTHPPSTTLVNALASSSSPSADQSSSTSKKNLVVPLGSLSVSPVALGSLNLFGNNDAVGKRNGDNNNNKSAVVELLQGLPASTLLDTAEIYGKDQAEAALGAAIREVGVGKLDVYIATKFAPQFQRSTPESIVAACRDSIQRLGVNDAIDLYQVHYADNLRPLVAMGLSKEQDEVYWDGLAECYHSGLARNVGVCNYGPVMLRRAHAALSQRGVPLASNQIGYNLMRLGVTRETKAVCDEAVVVEVVDVSVASESEEWDFSFHWCCMAATHLRSRLWC